MTLNKRKITIVAGARPNFVKVAPLFRQYHAAYSDKFLFRLVHTGQHYDKNLSDIFFQELNIPFPDAHLGAGSGSQAEQTAKIMVEFERELTENPTDLVIVVGDVNSTMACTIVAKKMNTKVAHIEAGIRSFDDSMPEEINRRVTDALADYFFTTSSYANENLHKLGVDSTKIFFVGNIMIDSLVWILKNKNFYYENVTNDPYFVLTLHRPSNVDEPERFLHILEKINNSCSPFRVIYPVHPRVKKMLDTYTVNFSNILFTEPFSYFNFIYLVKNSAGVVTDSGGIQEETTYLHIPCITLRNNTERPETVTIGSNILIKDDWEGFDDWFEKMKLGQWKSNGIPEKWDGQTASRILEILTNTI